MDGAISVYGCVSDVVWEFALAWEEMYKAAADEEKWTFISKMMVSDPDRLYGIGKVFALEAVLSGEEQMTSEELYLKLKCFTSSLEAPKGKLVPKPNFSLGASKDAIKNRFF